MFLPQEANQKICPIMSPDSSLEALGEVRLVKGETKYCVADQCMLWRWVTPKSDGDNRHGMCSQARGDK